MTGKLVKFATGGENEGGNLNIAKDGKLKSLLKKTISSFEEGHLSACWILYSLQHHFPSPHMSPSLSLSLSLSLSSLNQNNLCLRAISQYPLTYIKGNFWQAVLGLDKYVYIFSTLIVWTLTRPHCDLMPHFRWPTKCVWNSQFIRLCHA